jgi:hypothetical protein
VAMEPQTSSKKQKIDSGKRVYHKGLCPCCNQSKILSKSLNRSHVAAAVCAHKPLVRQFINLKMNFKDGNCSFKVCSNCYTTASEAVKIISGQYPAIPLFQKQGRTAFKSAIIETPFAVTVEDDGDILDLVSKQYFFE